VAAGPRQVAACREFFPPLSRRAMSSESASTSRHTIRSPSAHCGKSWGPRRGGRRRPSRPGSGTAVHEPVRACGLGRSASTRRPSRRSARSRGHRPLLWRRFGQRSHPRGALRPRDDVLVVTKVGARGRRPEATRAASGHRERLLGSGVLAVLGVPFRQARRTPGHCVPAWSTSARAARQEPPARLGIPAAVPDAVDSCGRTRYIPWGPRAFGPGDRTAPDVRVSRFSPFRAVRRARHPGGRDASALTSAGDGRRRTVRGRERRAR
jgi:hypothetical protein